jgi:hypothetical protein
MFFIVMTTSSQNAERTDQYFTRFSDFSLAGSPPPSVNSIYNNFLRIKVPTTPFTHPYTPTHTLFFFQLAGLLITNAKLVETRALFDAAPFRAPLILRVCHFIFH